MKTLDHTLYFKEQLAFLFLNLTRKSETISIENIRQSFKDVLYLLKSELGNYRKNGVPDNEFPYVEHLKIIYKLIANTRDIVHGKGEHDLFYMMIYELYLFFPTLAVYLIYHIEKFGGWRDIKYLCHYVRDHSPKKEEDEFICICIELINQQLKKDIESWKYSVNAGSRNHISNLSKWIPREKKKFRWLFEKLAIHWSNHYSRWKLSCIDIHDTSYIPALIKSKQQYRKIVSRMNKNLDTTEIKQCSQRWDEIDPNKVSKYTIMKQSSLFLSYYRETNSTSMFDLCNEIAKRNCSLKYIERTMNTDNIKKKHTIIQLPISYFVKEAFRLIKCNSKQKNVIVERDILNKNWTLFLKNYNFFFGNILPMVDISYKMLECDSESFYTGIGLALLVAQKSSFGKRILALENQPTWINLDTSIDFCNSIETIYEMIRSEQNTAFSFEKGIDFLMNAFMSSQSTIKNMKLILFSNSLTNNIDNYYDYLQKQYTVLHIEPPHIIFWNLSKTDICELPLCYDHIGLLSGFSSNLLKYVNNIEDPYSFICKVLSQPQYDLLERYLEKCVNIVDVC
jgi:hypothetical protein